MSQKGAASMLRIGDFARLGRVSVVALRHYDEIGLLKPAVVDAFTSYRYYSVEQLGQLNRIVALKDLGFSLAQINDVIGGVTLEQLRGMLTMRRAEAEHRLQEVQDQLFQINARLNQIGQEETMPEFDVVLKHVAATLVASRRVTIPTNDEVPAFLGAAFDETYEYVAAGGAQEVGPCIALWHQPAEVLANEVAEAAVQIDRPMAGNGRIAVYELPGCEMASVVIRGSYDQFTHAHAVILSWLESHSYVQNGPTREVYIRDSHEGQGEAVTEIQYPIAPH